ncbi:hypothetical protein PDESU_03621 [Pontiella desulfatans]|uniref:Uncharacterized protein n=1 Tax=Pontiella desulfatans TaxID=2750659 RepID=A0A6C2U690_PONDE|nr:hypothetical protein [Pontiella desulfatans]VGO15041.1 hypothetical protein PDESU_03621 [Pontiella desulfatans]
MRIDWKNFIALAGILLLLINFASVKEYVRVSSPFADLNNLPMDQRNLVVLGIIIVTGLLIHEIRKAL